MHHSRAEEERKVCRPVANSGSTESSSPLPATNNDLWHQSHNPERLSRSYSAYLKRKRAGGRINLHIYTLYWIAIVIDLFTFSSSRLIGEYPCSILVVLFIQQPRLPFSLSLQFRNLFLETSVLFFCLMISLLSFYQSEG